jgi:beta-aspartyl-peptidase (threonine type)
MDGRDLRAGAVACLRRIKNPVALARLVLERSPHVYLQGAGAEAFAATSGMARVAPRYFHAGPVASARNSARAARDLGTVGAVALDRHGNLAAATSTGGMTKKLPGRVGDSSVIGAGTYASNASCAVSCTGHGEYFIRAGAAHEICALVEHAGKEVGAAVHRVIKGRLRRLGGRGGAIAVDCGGRFACAFNTEVMLRGAVTHDSGARVAFRGRDAL